MSLAMTDYLENQLQNHLFRTSTFAKPTALHVAALSTLPSNDSLTGAVELVMTGYARIQRNPADANWSDPTAGTQGEVDNAAEIDFGVLTGTPERAIGVVLYDAATAGNGWFWGALATGWVPGDVNDTGDVITKQSHGFVNDDRVFLRNIVGAGGYSQQVEYFVVGATTDTFQIALTSGGVAVDPAADGSCEIGLSKAKDIGDGDQLKFNASTLKVAMD